MQTVLPVPYSIPMDGSVGEVMSRTAISPMRPSHIHFLIEAQGHHRVITHLFKKSCPYIETDVVYGLKAPLIAEFKLMPAGSTTPKGNIAERPFWLLEYDFVLQPVERRRQALRPDLEFVTGRKLALPSGQLATEFGVDHRAQPLVAGIAVESFMPILRNLEFRQFDRWLRQPHVELARQHGRNRPRHRRNSIGALGQDRSGGEARHMRDDVPRR